MPPDVGRPSRIGEVAEKAGVSVRALRYYEEQGLLQAGCSPGGQRHYPDTAVGRVRLIQQLYAAGLPSRVVREVLPCVDTGEEKTDQRIIDLLAVRDQLDDVIAIARDPDSDCSHVQ
ncbi:MerR family transcription regulator [Streptomyces himastatinicus ATCC 53653]|uniref:MerR family transcription regulator n=1 Tax=Streptomyces himastatinicus ATCC 53653 TaxID=457427 RepID=D9WL81_9ACTN|nr:MerR family transcriptional regulator [Streptomyces himastatinicus]EFL29356.1 MerR family transcription regulator [Streptomyces himastatinicus ATCC 53653]